MLTRKQIRIIKARLKNKSDFELGIVKGKAIRSDKADAIDLFLLVMKEQKSRDKRMPLTDSQRKAMFAMK